ncbi:GNAT family N-acetyltransferase [Chitinimonas sp. JJ19]|uniref:GNAT family N-acetyltransferase n=1 Tax=Chitinimonas sp. JJ19 TaxID=3109352 RepID=UPI003001BF16
MKDWHFASLEGVPLAQLYQAFAAAFADYLLPMQLDEAGLHTMLQRRGYVPGLSGGVFAGERLIGFHFICQGDWQGRRTAYDTASGVLPEARGQRLSQQLFAWLVPRWREQGVQQALLEVLAENTAARRSYAATGFALSRQFDCLQLQARPPLALPEAMTVVVDASNEWPAASLDWLTAQPAWQNSVRALAASPQRFERVGLYRQGELQALALLNPLSGELPLFAVHPSYRCQGLGQALIASAAARSDKPLYFNNLDADGPSVQLLRKLGATSVAQQHEMRWDLA